MKTKAVKFAKQVIGLIFLLAMVPVTVVHHILVVAKLPVNADALVTRAFAIIDAMSNNDWFPTPTPGLPIIKAMADDLRSAQIITKARVPGSVKERNVKKTILVKGLYALRDYVQSICDANPESSEAIATSALFFVKKVGGKAKHAFSVIVTKSGSVELTGKIKGYYRSHDWQMTDDPKIEANWYVTPLPSTLKSKTTVDNLTPGKRLYFRHRVITKDGPSDWDGVITIIIT